jgi:uncharacterized membrane protein
MQTTQVTTTTSAKPRPRRVTVVAGLIGVALTIVVMFVLARLMVDVPNVRAGTVPDQPFARNYVGHPWPAYLHIAPGLVYLLGAPFQLSAGFRRRHLALHRQLGRALIGCAAFSVGMAVLIGFSHPFGGWSEGAATVVFGLWLLACLAAAFAAVRRRDIVQHRRWMIRAFAVGIGIATIRLWVGLFIALHHVMTSEPPNGPVASTFGLAFWLGLGVNAAIGEWWLRRPAPQRVPVTSGSTD